MRNLKKQHNLSTFFVQSIDIDPHRRYYGGHTGSTQGQERQRPGEYHCGRTQAGFGGSGELQRQSGGTPVDGVV